MGVAPLSVFVAGATGFLGQPLVEALLARGHRVRALVRDPARARLPSAAERVGGDALAPNSFARALAGCDAYVHLVGVRRPAPWKARAFVDVDLGSVQSALAALRGSGVRHFVYLSVAQPAPVMKRFVWARREAEILIRSEGYAASFVRPWYVLGPGRRWPLALLPIYALCERLPWTREGAQRLGLVTRAAAVAGLAWAIEHPPEGVRVLDVPRLQSFGREREPAGELEPVR